MNEQPFWLKITFVFVYYMKVRREKPSVHACTSTILCEGFSCLNFLIPFFVRVGNGNGNELMVCADIVLYLFLQCQSIESVSVCLSMVFATTV